MTNKACTYASNFGDSVTLTMSRDEVATLLSLVQNHGSWGARSVFEAALRLLVGVESVQEEAERDLHTHPGVVMAIRDGKKILAIKELRAIYGGGLPLLGAKLAVEARWDDVTRVLVCKDGSDWVETEVHELRQRLTGERHGVACWSDYKPPAV